MKREKRRVCFFSFTGKDKYVSRVRVAQVFAVDRAVRSKDFGEAQADLSSGRASGFQSHPANHVLAHVEDVTAV
jgi:hypothetical protein